MGLNPLIAVVLLGASVGAVAGGETIARKGDPRKPIEWRQSVAAGDPAAGRLIRGVLLPPEGLGWRSWDPIERSSPARQWRRWGTDDLVRTTLGVIREFRRRHPDAPPILVGDLSRPRGGDFGPEYGFIGHATHQNGRDVDVYYPRIDGRPKPPESPDQVDLKLAQDLVDLFLEAGPEVIYVGPNLALNGPPGLVVPLDNHDNHLHFRIEDGR